ncbi:MAG: hypothetical protein JO269_11275 [Burkholderiaceae bacterium]|nr:hypothetical protein [Burkholderiaceae bacterium]
MNPAGITPFKKTGALPFAVACLCALLSGCDAYEPDITGKWTCADPRNPGLEVELKPTGDYSVVYQNGLPPEHGKYERQHQRIIYTPAEDPPPSPAEIAAAAADDTEDDTPPIPRPALPDKIVINSRFSADGVLLGHYSADASNSQHFCTSK